MAQTWRSRPKIILSNGLSPKQGPVGYLQQIDFSTVSEYLEDLTQAQRVAGFEGVQAMWIDNSLNAAYLQIEVQPFGQLIKIPPKNQGYLNILSHSDGSKLIIRTTSAASLMVQVGYLNFHVDPILWQAAP